MGTLIARMMVHALDVSTLNHTSPIGTFVVTIGILPL
jgi:hypothetical protein